MRLVSVSEAAYLLSVTPMTIRNWCDQGKLNFIQVADLRHVDLWTFLKEQGVNPQPLFDSLEERKANNAVKTRRTRKTA
jgi:excisionase family DNA binding protein